MAPVPDTPRRTLDRPPSVRYADREPGEVRPADSGPPTGPDARLSRRADLAAVGAAIVTAIGLVGLGGVLGWTSGPLFVSGLGGAAVGLLAAGSARPPRLRRRLALVLALLAVVGGAAGDWLIALAEGGALGPLDYLWATSGLLVPGELVIAALAAAWGVRAGPIRG
jgi:hypothetical protein